MRAIICLTLLIFSTYSFADFFNIQPNFDNLRDFKFDFNPENYRPTDCQSLYDRIQEQEKEIANQREVVLVSAGLLSLIPGVALVVIPHAASIIITLDEDLSEMKKSWERCIDNANKETQRIQEENMRVRKQEEQDRIRLEAESKKKEKRKK